MVWIKRIKELIGAFRRALTAAEVAELVAISELAVHKCRDPKTSAPISSSRTALVGPKQYGDSAATFAVSSPSPSARVCWLDRPQIAWPLQTGPLPVSRPTNLSGLSTSALRSQAGRGPRQAEQPSCSQAGFRPRKVLIWHKGCSDFTRYPKPDAPCLQRNTVTVGLCRAMRPAHDDVCVRVRID
jgi:hypothetical protein